MLCLSSGVTLQPNLYADLYMFVSQQTGGLADRLAEAAAHATDPLARQGAFEAYQALITDIGAPVEPFVALVLSTILDKCSDKVPPPSSYNPFDCPQCLLQALMPTLCQLLITAMPSNQWLDWNSKSAMWG